MQSGMLSISILHVSGVITVHSASNLLSSSSLDFAIVLYCESHILRWCQRCSIRFKSGDCAGHCISLMLMLSNHVVVFFDMCFGSLSCWNMMSVYACWSCKSEIVFTSLSFKISMYWSEFIEPSTKHIPPTPSHVIPPQIMMELLLNLTVGLTSLLLKPAFLI